MEQRVQKGGEQPCLRLANSHNGICDGFSIYIQRFHGRYRISRDTSLSILRKPLGYFLHSRTKRMVVVQKQCQSASAVAIL
jgi:hypothetical protein